MKEKNPVNNERRNFLKFLFGLPAISLIPGTKTESRILILETVLAGFNYYSAELVWSKLQVGDELILRRQPHNPYDHKAVEVFWRRHKLGYLPRVDNSAISQMMGRGQSLRAYISWLNVDDNPWKRIGINVELVL